jgi:acetyl-CoA synthetase
VAEAAVVGRPDELKGQAVVCFVTLKGDLKPSDQLRGELRPARATGHRAGRNARRDHFHEAMPKTRSGKIMRRLLKRSRVERR